MTDEFTMPHGFVPLDVFVREQFNHAPDHIDATQEDREAAPTADDLKAFGYAPGYYIGGCRDCTPEQKRDGRMLAKRAWRCEEHATIAWRSRPQIFTPAMIEWSSGETARLQREISITNADHIALWLEANGLQDNLAWMAVRIAEAHLASTAALQAERDALAKRVEALEGALKQIWARRYGDWCEIARKALGEG